MELKKGDRVIRKIDSALYEVVAVLNHSDLRGIRYTDYVLNPVSSGVLHLSEDKLRETFHKESEEPNLKK